MSKYWTTSKLIKAVAILTGTTGGLVAIKHFIYDDNEQKTRLKGQDTGNNILPAINASRTTNHSPSVSWDYNWDRREPSNLQKPAKRRSYTDINNNSTTNATDDNKLKELVPKASRHLILIRHGQYQTEAKQDKDQVLTALGREQAHLTGARLKELGFPYSVIINSTMARAAETASIISQYLPDVKALSTDLIREGAPIPPEPPVGHWRPELHQFYRDGSRIEAAFRENFHRADVSQEKDSYEILVCHANVIRYFVCRALQFPPEAWLRISLHHASVTWLTIRPSGRVSIYTLGDCGHMPPNKLSYR